MQTRIVSPGTESMFPAGVAEPPSGWRPARERVINFIARWCLESGRG